MHLILTVLVVCQGIQHDHVPGCVIFWLEQIAGLLDYDLTTEVVSSTRILFDAVFDMPANYEVTIHMVLLQQLGGPPLHSAQSCKLVPSYGGHTAVCWP